MMGGRRDGLRLISTSPIAINNLYYIEQGKVVDIFRPTSMSCTIIPNIYLLGVRVSFLVPIPKYPITTNSISW